MQLFDQIYNTKPMTKYDTQVWDTHGAQMLIV